MKLSAWCELYLGVEALLALRLVYVACNHFVFCLDGDEDVLKMVFCLRTEFIQWNRWVEAQLVVLVAIEFLVFYAIDALRTVASCIQVVQILDEGRFGERDGKCIHCVVTMVVSLGPILDSADGVSIFVLECFCEAELVVFVPIEFFHHIYQLPILAQTVCDASCCWNDNTYNLF